MQSLPNNHLNQFNDLKEKMLSLQIHQLLNEANPLQQDLDFCLAKLDLEDSVGNVCPDSISINSSHSGISNRHGSSPDLNSHSQQETCTPHSQEIDLELFKQKIKAIIGSPSCQLQPMDMQEDNRDHKASQISTNYKQRNPYKSRQVSIHTNAFLATECGDNISNKNELFSTVFTTQVDSHHHQRVTSNTGKSFFTQNNTFISYDQDNNNQAHGTASQSDCETPRQIVETQKKQLKATAKLVETERFKQLIEAQHQMEDQLKLQIQKRLISNEQDIKLRKNLKRKIKAAVEDPALVPMSVFQKILSFDGRMFSVFTKLSRGFRKHLLFHIFDSTQSISQSFMKKYGQVFQVERRFLTQTPISFGKEEGSRVDLILQVRVKKEAKKLEDRSVIIGYCYNHQKTDQEKQLRQSVIEGEFNSLYQLDLFRAGVKRWTWLHKDECLFHGLTDARAYSMPIMPICTGDSFTLSLTLISLMGCLEIPSVRWMPLRIEAHPVWDDVRNYNRFKNLTPDRDMYRKYFADLKRVCEAEDTIVEWFYEPYARTNSLKSHIKRRLDAKQFEDQFDIDTVEVGGIDFSVWKLHLRAKKTPKTAYKFYQELNTGIKVIASSAESLCNEVKRVGFLIDRGEDLELRGGDTLIVYVSMGGFEK